MTVDVNCPRPAVLSARCDESLATVDVRQTRESPQQYQVEISPRDDLSVGEHRFSVYLRPRMAPGDVPSGMTVPPELPLAVVANVARGVYVSPSTIHFGALAVGETTEETVVLRSMHSKRFAVLESGASGGNSLRVEPEAAVPEQGPWFRIWQRIDRVGPHTGEVRFVVQEEDSRQSYAIVLPVSFHGIRK
jgi:hypothetical protein